MPGFIHSSYLGQCLYAVLVLMVLLPEVTTLLKKVTSSIEEFHLQGDINPRPPGQWSCGLPTDHGTALKKSFLKKATIVFYLVCRQWSFLVLLSIWELQYLFQDAPTIIFPQTTRCRTWKEDGTQQKERFAVVLRYLYRGNLSNRRTKSWFLRALNINIIFIKRNYTTRHH